MALAKQPPTTIPFVGGIDTKTHKHVLRSPQLLELDNVDLHEPGAISKRRGYEQIADGRIDGGSVIGAWTGLYRFGDRGVVRKHGELFEYIEGEDKLSLTAASADVASAKSSAVSGVSSVGTEYAYTNGYEIIADSFNIVVREHGTGIVVLSRPVQATTSQVRAVAVDDTLMVFTIEGVNLRAYYVDTTSLPTSIPSTIVKFDAGSAAMDVVSNAFGEAVVVYDDGTNLNLLAVSKVGTGGSEATWATSLGGGTSAIAVYYDGTDYLVAWQEGVTSIDVQAVSSVFVVGSTHVLNGSASAASQLTMSFGSGSDRVRVAWYDQTSRSVKYDESDIDGTSVTSTLRELFGVRLGSKLIFHQNDAYAVLLSNVVSAFTFADFQATYILCRLTDDGDAWEPIGQAYYERGAFAAGGAGHVPNIVKVDGDLVQAAAYTINFSDATTAESVPVRLTWKINGGNAVAANEALLFAGGATYAGGGLQQIGFPWAPVIDTIAESSGGDLDSTGTYSYVAVYEYEDDAGNVHRSAPSIPRTFGPLTGSNKTINITIRPFFDRDDSARIIIYRTSGDGTIHYRLDTQPSSGMRASDGITVAFADTEADDETNRILYTQGGAVLDNHPPPSAEYYALHRNRVWAIDGLTGDLTPSKELVDGEGPAFSPALVVRGRLDGAHPVAIVSQGTHLVVFWPKAIGIVQGDGPNDAGSGGAFTPVDVFKGSQVGCSNPLSVIQMPRGVMFEDEQAGIHLLPNGGGLPVFVGDRVEDLRAGETIIGANLLEDRECVTFTMVSGKQLVYWYSQNRWSTALSPHWDSVNGESVNATAVWGGLHILAGNGGTIGRTRTDGVFRDNLDGIDDYHRTVTTGWISLEQMLRLARVWNIFLLGENVDTQDLTVRVYRDHDDTLFHDHAYSAVTADPLRLRVAMRTQKVEAIKIRLLDAGGAGNYGATKWTAMQLDWGARQRGPRLNRENGAVS